MPETVLAGAPPPKCSRSPFVPHTLPATFVWPGKPKGYKPALWRRPPTAVMNHAQRQLCGAALAAASPDSPAVPVVLPAGGCFPTR